MKNTFKLFIICCGLTISINSNIEAMDNNKYFISNLENPDSFHGYLGGDPVGNETYRYVALLNYKYGQLYDNINKELEQLNNLNGTNNEQLQEIQKYVTKALDVLKKSLNDLAKSFKSELYDAFVYDKNNIDHIVVQSNRIFKFDKLLNLCYNPQCCQLIVKCHVCLFELLNIFNYLENNNYYVNYSSEIKQLILALKNSLSL